MGVYSRLSDIVNSNLHSMLDKAEDPEKMIRLIIQEMEDTLVEVRSTSVRSIARRKALEREMVQLDKDMAEWEAKAELAIRKEREDLARAALLYKSKLDEKKILLAEEQEIIRGELEKLDADVSKLNIKLKDAKSRQKSLIMRRQNATTRLKAKRQVNESRLADALTKFEHYEGRIDSLEAQVEAEDLGEGRSLAEEFAELEADESVEAELARLRAKVAGSGEPQAKD